MKLKVDHVSASESGDYFQVLFQDEGDGDRPYVLVQRQFEDDDDGLCYLETHNEEYIGHFDVARAALDRNRFYLALRRKEAAEVDVTFNTPDHNYREIVRIIRIMIPCPPDGGPKGWALTQPFQPTRRKDRREADRQTFGSTESGSASVSESRHDMGSAMNNENNGAAIPEQAAGYGGVGIDSDSDSDSDPEPGSRAAGQPNTYQASGSQGTNVPRRPGRGGSDRE